jgi:hypothetical protein
MKKIFTAPSVVPCDFLVSLLSAEGISCVILNEYGTHLLCEGLPVPGGSALSWAWPEVWIPDEDVERAMPLVEEFQKSEREPADPIEAEQPEE